MNRDMLSRRLQKRGYEVLIAVDGQHGVAMAQSESPDLILMDMSLPIIDGWEATRALKAGPETKHIPVIALTAHAMSTDRDKAIEAGCDDYDTKPIELPRLLLSWQSPARSDPADANLDLLAAILARGKASRLYERLVHKDEVAAQVSADQESRELVSSFAIDALARPGHTTAELLAAIDDELKRLVAEGPTQAEINSARTRIYTDTARGLEGLVARATRLTTYQLDYGKADGLQQDLGRYEQATIQSVQEAGRKLLATPRVIVEVAPEAK